MFMVSTHVYYGSFCQYRCSVGCVNGRCNKGNGHCTGGCKSNFVGDKCDMCSSGLYGPFCDLNCKENCSACFSETNCTTCKSGFFGETCTNTCPIGCKGNCYFADGRCLECKPGFFGDFCNIACNDEKYGVDCSKLCRDKDVNCQMCIVNQFGDYVCCTKNVSAMITDREGFSVGTLIGSIIGSFLAGGIVTVTTLFSFITLRRRLGKNEETENNLVPDVTHEVAPPVAYEDFNSRVEISYSQITTNQQISPPEAVYVNTRF
ncbi:platelet endothelial aggregation receptor 1-like [Ruditapes philippinarum]|uniref:platelet endothelial aggregation receptor 1-like n=1 Tax=Ruditapes philippinarum TaxID=129788 RepID=UPI00295BB688|nr:platelet endothelial aggregation receptor 1-like [Ruditapes philippinarum]